MNTATKSRKRKPATPEQIERARALKDEALAKIAQGLTDVTQDPEQLRRYLEFRAAFRERSFRNTMLLHVQAVTRGGATGHFMGFRAWQQHGRCVRKGEKRFMVLAPVTKRVYGAEAQQHGVDEGERACVTFRVASVFDIQQTAPIPGEEALTPVSLIPELPGDGHAHVRDGLEVVARHLGYAVEYYDPAEYAADGFVSFAKDKIAIKQGTANAAALTLAHEIAHALAHDPRKTEEGKTAEGIAHRSRELQAEGAAFLACTALGLDTTAQSLPYLKSYIDSHDEVVKATAEEAPAARRAVIGRELAAIDELGWSIVDRLTAVLGAAAATN